MRVISIIAEERQDSGMRDSPFPLYKVNVPPVPTEQVYTEATTAVCEI